MPFLQIARQFRKRGIPHKTSAEKTRDATTQCQPEGGGRLESLKEVRGRHLWMATEMEVCHFHAYEEPTRNGCRLQTERSFWSPLSESAIAIAPRERFWQGPVCPVLPSSTFHMGGPLDFHEDDKKDVTRLNCSEESNNVISMRNNF